MSYFTERNNLRTPIQQTQTISVSMYSLLMDCCDRYLESIAWLLPAECTDGRGIYGVDYNKMYNSLEFEIPTLFRDSSGNIVVPGTQDEYNQYALLDYIEFISQNCRLYQRNDYHSFFSHWHLSFYEDDETKFGEFQKDINGIFEKTGLLYTLTDQKTIERVVEFDVLTEEIVNDAQQVQEYGIKDLLEEAINIYKQPNPANNHLAVEKMWDALERLKTYYTVMDKRASVTKIINDMASSNPDFISIFDEEFKVLTSIGNNYRIRHHETNKIDITDLKHFDYFFNRCLSLIALAIHYLN